MRKILVATDFSEDAQLAAAQAVRLGAQLRGEVWLVHACEHTVQRSGRRTPGLEAAVERHMGAVRRGLNALAERLARPDVSLSTSIVQGEPGAALAEAAAAFGADLVVTGTRGLTGFRRLLLGSTAERILRRALVDVLVVREPGREPGREPAQEGSPAFGRLLVATDFSAAGHAAVTRARDLLRPGSVVDLMHVLPSPFVAHAYAEVAGGAPVEMTNWRDAQRTDAETALSAQADRLAPSLARVVQTIAEGSPRAEILRRLERGDCDLAVVGRGADGPGGVAEAVARHAPCSVLVVAGGGRTG